MNTQTVITIFLASALLFSVADPGHPRSDGAHILWDRQGYAPEQPIAFSHRLHAGELQVDCRYCHFGAESEPPRRHPGGERLHELPSLRSAHRLGALRAEDELATSGRVDRRAEKIVSPEIQKIYDALALDEDLARDETREPDPIEWIKIHRSPDYVYFDHRAHVSAGVECQRCHGAVESMERVRQVEDLSLGWCVNCHRHVNETGVAGQAVDASLDCSVCHY